MNETVELLSVTEGGWTMTYPLKVLGVDINRVVTVLELGGGKLLVHSAALFGPMEVAAILTVGEPVWLVEALLRHDTFAAEGRVAFPQARYFAPPAFKAGNGIKTESLATSPQEWAGEIDLLEVDGVPEYGEFVMLHRVSKTLVVGDLVVNVPKEGSLRCKLMLTLGAIGGHTQPGVTRPFKHAIKDEAAFLKSLETIRSWDFERIIVGHGEAVMTDPKIKLRRAFESAGVRAASIPEN